MVEINDAYRNEGKPKPSREQWTSKDFTEKKSSFFNTILFIKDINKPSEFKILKSNIWTDLGFEYITQEIELIADLERDEGSELLVSNRYYEYTDYAVIELN